ncbi:MAG: undecaprenyl-diphosphate phosphatase [Acidimicrobiia bacterium]|nr:undecaprenyl-diphosphate phosphatase [Acidimicrobiia bacterium]
MPIFHAIVLGAVQGFTEFFPVSSSGHLVIVPWLFGWDDFDDESVQKAFDVAVHLGTLVAVVHFFRRDIGRLVVEGIAVATGRRRPASVDGRLAWLLVLATVPAAVVGVVANDLINDLDDELWLIALMLIVFGIVLFIADRLIPSRSADSFAGRDATAMGIGQSLALQPGVSRSAVTISVARRLGFDREAAARLAFLMSMPLIVGAAVFQFNDVGGLDGIPSDLRWPFIVGIVTSAVTGWLAVWGTLRLVQTRSFAPFVVYRIALGVLVLALLATPWR